MPGKKKTTRPEDVRLAELTADLQRTQADFINFKRRTEAERMRVMEIARADVVQELLPLVDDVERAITHLPKELEGNTWANGVIGVAKQLDSTLRKLGIERIEALHQPFDPELHDAVSSDGEGETVIEELRPGYRLGDTILRHSMVRVGKGRKDAG